MILTLDLETTTHNKGNPYDTRNFVVSAHTKVENENTQCIFYDAPDFKTNIREHLARASLLVGVNLKFDLAHLRNHGLQPPVGCRIWDCMVAEFVLSGQTNSLAGLNELAALYKLGQKEDVVKEYWDKGISTEDIPRDVVESYGNHDVGLSYDIYRRQLTDPRITPALHRLILLSGLDLLVLGDMEWNGFRFDVDGAKFEAEKLGEELLAVDKELIAFSPHSGINLDSGDQLSCFLFGGSYDSVVTLPVEKVYKSGPKKGQTYTRNEFQYESIHEFKGFFTPSKGSELAKSTEGRRLYSTAEDVLSQLKAKTKQQKRIIELLSRRSYLSKLCGTYLVAFPKLIEDMHWADNTIHGQFNQTIVRTGRLSSSKPNMQNAPEEVDEFFITRY